MPRNRKGTPPAYPSQPHNGQARLTVRLTTGSRHCIYLGAFGGPDSRKEYHRVLLLLEGNGGCYPVNVAGQAAFGLTLNEVAVAFWTHAEKYYRLLDGSPSREQDHFETALRPLLDHFGDQPAIEFGPVKLKALRQRLIDQQKYLLRPADQSDTPTRWLPEHLVLIDEGVARWAKQWVPAEILKGKPALSRKVINQRVDHIKRFFAWAVSEELVPSSVHDALKLVAGLRRGYEGTRDTGKVKPVPDQDVEASLPHLLPQVAAMVRVQPLLGARPTEVCLMRGRNIRDRDKPVWKYILDPNEVAREDEPQGRLANLHKTGHQDDAEGHAKVKVLPIGPRAQEILKPWLRDDPDEFLFQPREARAARYAARRGERKTPLWSSHVQQQAQKKKANPKRTPRDHYDRHSYGQAVRRAAKKAGVAHWHPHQLKHVCGTRVRAEHGAEAARGYMGHDKLSTAELYAERNWKLMEKIAMEMG